METVQMNLDIHLRITYSYFSGDILNNIAVLATHLLCCWSTLVAVWRLIDLG